MLLSLLLWLSIPILLYWYPSVSNQPWITSDPVIACVFPKGQLMSLENWVLWEKTLANFKDNVVLYFNILQKYCLYIDPTIKLYLFNNVPISQLINISIYLHIYLSLYYFIISLVLQELINVFSDWGEYFISLFYPWLIINYSCLLLSYLVFFYQGIIKKDLCTTMP